ncbi:MAG: pantoate--beta-alanine ligase [Planctomycetota bacterium]|jgi:pantoate--beta-alanine ligase
MRIVNGVTALQDALMAVSTVSGPVLVPTMGALHAGHIALIQRGRGLGSPLVASIFVNPTQFNAEADLAAYPRTLDEDAAACRAAGVDVLFSPDESEVYPPDENVPVPPLPAVATAPGLEDAHRPGHFDGVCQVVARLFDLVRPRHAVFGLKDYQQWLVVNAMVAAAADDTPDRWPGLELTGVETVREPGGLAMSSRNARLSTDERACARGLGLALQSAAAANHPAAAETLMRETLEGFGLSVEYAVVRDAQTLLPVESFSRPTRALVAAHVGKARLIDNAGLPVWS